MTDAPRAYTAEEGRELFFNHLAGIYDYWAKLPNPHRSEGQTVEQARMEGLLFSILVLFDGGSGFMPGFDIYPSPHPDDEEYNRSQGENWWSTEVCINADTAMHEIFPWKDLR